MARVVSPRFEVHPIEDVFVSKVTGVFANTKKKYSRDLGERATLTEALDLIADHSLALGKLEILIHPN